MPVDQPQLTVGLGAAMRHLAERQRVIAQNIANSETPGYRANEVDAPDFSGLLAATEGAGAPRVARPRIELTGALRSLGARPPATASAVHPDRNPVETKPDGNNVTLEEQLLKMGQVQADFAAVTKLYAKQQALMRTAIGRGGS
jgi:flagellar basal-body rod protein FlgB